jgi:hypothetical protein
LTNILFEKKELKDGFVMDDNFQYVKKNKKALDQERMQLLIGNLNKLLNLSYIILYYFRCIQL